MPINPDAVGQESDPVSTSWTSKDALLYAVGIGAGTNELAFTTENTNGVDQQVLPDDGGRARLGAWAARCAASARFNPAMLVHGEQRVTLHKPIPPEGSATLKSKLVGIYDKGKAAVVATETTATDEADGTPLYTNYSSAFIRGEGGWGGDRGPSGPRNVPPEREPDHEVTYQTLARPGPRLPAVRRPQPAALRPVVRGDGRLRPPDPARPVHVRLHRPGAAARAVRLRPGPLPAHRRPVLVAGPAGRRPHRHDVGDRAGRGGVHDVASRTARSSSTRAACATRPDLVPQPSRRRPRRRDRAGSRGSDVVRTRRPSRVGTGGSEQAELVGAQAAQLVVVDLDPADAARLGQVRAWGRTTWAANTPRTGRSPLSRSRRSM